MEEAYSKEGFRVGVVQERTGEFEGQQGHPILVAQLREAIPDSDLQLTGQGQVGGNLRAILQ